MYHWSSFYYNISIPKLNILYSVSSCLYFIEEIKQINGQHICLDKYEW